MAKRHKLVTKTEGQRKIPIRWPITSDLPIVYANQLLIDHSGPEFILVFGVIEGPMLINPTQEELNQLKEIRVRPVAKIAVSLEMMPSMAKAIDTNVMSFMRQIDELSKLADNSDASHSTLPETGEQ